MSAPLVSVAMATWNGERYLREQLDSIQAQSYRPLEVVVSDDASTDGTVAVLEEYAKAAGLRYVVNPARLGLVRNFERAIALCRGEYVALCDQDDLWKPQKIATLVAHLGDATLIYCNVGELLDVARQRGVESTFERINRFARAHGSGHPTRYLLAENWVVSHGMLFRRELATHALPIPGRQPFHDGWLALVASKLGGIRYLDQSLQAYRRHPGSHTFKPAKEPPSWRSFIPRFASGQFKRDWKSRCQAETARLQDALQLPLLLDADRSFIAELSRYYRSGLEPGSALASFRAGLSVAPFVATCQGRSRLWFALRGRAGGL